MRSILFLISAAASVASAQTPAKPAPAPKPHASEPTPPKAMTLPGHLAPLTGHLQLAEPLVGTFNFTPRALPDLDLVWGEAMPLAAPAFDYDWQVQGVPPRAAREAATVRAYAEMDGSGVWRTWSDDGGQRGTFSRIWPDQGTPEDSLYRAAREALNRGEYSRASAMFQSIEQKFPRSRVAPAALYYRAFALYRSGSTDEIKTAIEILKAQQERYPDAAADTDVLALRTRLEAALAARGDAQAAAYLRQASAGGATCDREDVEVRAEALNALAQINPPEARPTLKKVLARRDECSVMLRRRALYILGRSGTEESAADLLEAAKSDPDASVRSDAILFLARAPGGATVKTLQQLFEETTDDRTRGAVLSALRSRGGPEAKQMLKAIIERNDLSERMRIEAISQLAGSGSEVRYAMAEGSGQGATVVSGRRTSNADDEDAAYLRTLYTKTESQRIKQMIISGVARIGGTTNEQWVLSIAKNRDEDMRLRQEALSRLRSTSLSVDDLGKLFESLSERDLRRAVVSQLGSRDDPAATDKLIEIARSGTDPQIRREAISMLARKKDPRTTKLLLDLVEKP